MKYAYESFPVSEAQALSVREVRSQFSALSTYLENTIPQGRYSSLVETKLEEACMFAIKSITHGDRVTSRVSYASEYKPSKATSEISEKELPSSDTAPLNKN